MGTTPVTKNTVSSTLNQILKNLIEGRGVDAIEALMIADFPWLALPFVKQIFELCLNYAAKAIYTDAANLTTSIVINIQSSQENDMVKTTLANLEAAIDIGDQNGIAKASQEADIAFGHLIHWDGSSPA